MGWNSAGAKRESYGFGGRLGVLALGPGRPGLTSWVILSRPFGTDFVGNGHPALRAGLLSAVPSGLVPIHADSGLFSASSVKRPIEKANLDKTDSQPSPFDKLRAGSAGLVPIHAGALFQINERYKR
jgi:hypothetical protein